MKLFFCLGAVLMTLCSAGAYAAPAHCSGGQGVAALTRAYLPPGYVRSDNRAVHADGVRLQLTRYQPAASPVQYGSAHFSVLANAGGCVMGFIRLAGNAQGEPPARDEARAITERFLSHYAPDLLADYSLHSVGSQQYTVRVNGQMQALRGTLVKMHNRADGSWFWVVVGSGGQVMLFERDLRWSNLRFARTTERWLYDDWRAGRRNQ